MRYAHVKSDARWEMVLSASVTTNWCFHYTHHFTVFLLSLEQIQIDDISLVTVAFCSIVLRRHYCEFLSIN